MMLGDQRNFANIKQKHKFIYFGHVHSTTNGFCGFPYFAVLCENSQMYFSCCSTTARRWKDYTDRFSPKSQEFTGTLLHNINTIKTQSNCRDSSVDKATTFKICIQEIQCVKLMSHTVWLQNTQKRYKKNSGIKSVSEMERYERKKERKKGGEWVWLLDGWCPVGCKTYINGDNKVGWRERVTRVMLHLVKFVVLGGACRTAAAAMGSLKLNLGLKDERVYAGNFYFCTLLFLLFLTFYDSSLIASQ